MKRKRIYQQLKLRWLLFWFRFFISTGRAKWAQWVFNRIPLPEVVNGESFRSREQRLWGKYTGIGGNLRLFTTRGVLKSLVKVTAAAVLLVVLIAAGTQLAGRIAGLAEQWENRSLTDLQKGGGQRFVLTGGGSLAVDTSRSPLFTMGKLLLPVSFTTSGEEYTFYLSEKKFTGASQFLEDCRISREFLLAPGERHYYVYAPGGEDSGTWMDHDRLTGLKAEMLPKSEIWLVPQGPSPLQLRPGTGFEVPSLMTIPGEANLEFIRFAPISSIATQSVWARVKYTLEEGGCVTGWIPVLSLEDLYVGVDAEGDTNMLTVVANNLTFRDKPGTGAVKIEEVGQVARGEQMKFLKFASPMELFSSEYVRVQVQYSYVDGGVSKTYTGWIAAGKVKTKLTRVIEIPDLGEKGEKDK